MANKTWSYKGHEFPTKEERDDFKEQYEDAVISPEDLADTWEASAKRPKDTIRELIRWARSKRG